MRLPMVFEICYYPAARAELDRLSPDIVRRIVGKIDPMRHGLAGDVKKLKEFVPDYRLRVGDWRVLFEVSRNRTIVHAIKRRSHVDDR